MPVAMSPITFAVRIPRMRRLFGEGKLYWAEDTPTSVPVQHLLQAFPTHFQGDSPGAGCAGEHVGEALRRVSSNPSPSDPGYRRAAPLADAFAPSTRLRCRLQRIRCVICGEASEEALSHSVGRVTRRVVGQKPQTDRYTYEVQGGRKCPRSPSRLSPCSTSFV